jgi:hypothetical protein
MNVSTTIPPTVQIRRSRLLSLVGGVAVLVAAITWAVTHFAVDQGTASAQKSVRTQAAAASPAIPPSDHQHVRQITSLTPAQLKAALQSDTSFRRVATSDHQHVRQIRSLTPAQLRAAFGTGR